MLMAEKIIPWWRKALNYALGGIRSGFGLFPQPAQSVPLEDQVFFNRREESLEVETALADQPTGPETVPAVNKTVAAHSPASETVPAAAVAGLTPLSEPTGAAVIEPNPAQKTAPQPAPQRKPAGKLLVEPVTKAEPATQAKPTATAESVPFPVVSRPDPMHAMAPAAESHAVTVTEPAPVPESAPRRVSTPKRLIKLEARDGDEDQSPFSVVVEQVYDGPLDLLLDLIRKQDIDIYDIPIAKITAQFLAYVGQLRASDVDVAGEFIYTASLLIHIKSKMLLPRAPAGPGEVPEDPRRELVERLLEHERFKNAAQMLQQKQMIEAATWTNPGFREFQEDESVEPEIAADTVDLVRVFRDILERARSRPVFDVDEESVTVVQMIQFLARRLTMEDKPVALRRLLSHTRSERALIAMFLALLELVRMQAVLLRQDRQFSEIFIKKHTGFEAAMNEGLANARDHWK
jgi:segregation and condensation protein A